MKTKSICLFSLLFLSLFGFATTYTVINTSDNGNGSLRWAIDEVNSNSNTAPHIIEFSIPGSGPHTITIISNLPVITETVFIDGTSQSGYSYEVPTVILTSNNSLNVGRIIHFEQGSEGSEIKGILFTEIAESAIFCYAEGVSVIDNMFHHIGIPSAQWGPKAIGVYAGNVIIKGNVIGTDAATMTQNLGSSIGFSIYVLSQYLQANNCIIGGSNPGDANIIANMNDGVTINNADQNLISRNIVFNISGFPAIDLVNGNIMKSEPDIDGVDYCHGQVNVEGRADPYDIIELFGSSGPENANEYLTTVTADANGNWTAILNYSKWDYLVATATDQDNNTSELSDAFQYKSCDAATDPTYTKYDQSTSIGSMTWNGDYYIAPGVIITIGGTDVLNITNANIVLEPGAGIVAQDGAQIVGNNSQFSTCSDYDSWLGIEFNLNATGEFNNCTFENAHKALSALDYTMLTVTESGFLNNEYGIYIRTIDPTPHVIEYNTFETDPVVNDCYFDPSYGVYLSSTSVDYTINHNEFTNLNSNSSGVHGIYCKNSAFDSEENAFSSLNNAIKINGEYFSTPIHISNSYFNNNSLNLNSYIYISSASVSNQGVNIYENTFTDNYVNAHSAVRSYSRNYLTVENNTFENGLEAIVAKGPNNYSYFGNNQINNYDLGIWVFGERETDIEANAISNSTHGIQFTAFNNNSLYDPGTIYITDNCILYCDYAMFLQSFGQILQVPVIYHNYLYEYNVIGFNVSFLNGGIGQSCSSSPGLNYLERTSTPLNTDLYSNGCNNNYIGNVFNVANLITSVSGGGTINLSCNNKKSTYDCDLPAQPKKADPGLPGNIDDVFNIYPNPNKGNFTILAQSEIKSIKVLNSLGQQIWFRDQVESQQYEVNLENQPDGVYILYIQTVNNDILEKIIIE